MCVINSHGLPSSRQNPTNFCEELTAHPLTVGPSLQVAAHFSPTQGTKKPKILTEHEWKRGLYRNNLESFITY